MATRKRVSEKHVKAAVRKRLESHGVLPFNTIADMKDVSEVRGTYWMPVQGAYAVHGVHDFFGVWDGVPFSLETKAPDNKVDATEPQRAFQFAITVAGGISLVGVRDADVVDRLHELIIERGIANGHLT